VLVLKIVATDHLLAVVPIVVDNIKSLEFDVVVIDSGINSSIKTDGISIIEHKNKIITSQVFEDEIGHGTAINSIINKKVPTSRVFNIKIYKGKKVNPDLLLYALRYVYENIKCKVINISLGINHYSNISALYDICHLLNEKNIFLVAAFDNNGIVSYPAAFDNVIGVDASSVDLKIYEYDYIENSIVNIRGSMREQKLKWKNDKYEIVSGSSFIAPHITIKILSILDQNSGNLSYNKVLENLKKYSRKSIVFNAQNKYKLLDFTIKKAISFPFNKEIFPLARFKNRLKFEIVFCDTKYMGHIGKRISEILPDAICQDIIYNYECVDWTDNFDTIILGHISELSTIIKVDLLDYFVKKAIMFRKNIFCFFKVDNKYIVEMEDEGLKIYFPSAENENIINNFGKLYEISTPVLGIFGTGQRQGKYTLTLKLIELFENSGYKINSLGTEPNGELLGINYVYPIGYEKTISLQGYDSISYINSLMKKMEINNPDLIMVTSQSQSVPLMSGALKFYPILQHEFLLGTVPDCFILCITINDGVNYVLRTIKYLESIFNSKVICIALFPFFNYEKWSVYGNNIRKASSKKINNYISMIKFLTKKQCFDMTDKNSIAKIGKKVINFFR
jgi:hypothetical protein